jgi:plastocyanin
VINTATKAFIALAGAALVAAIGYAAVVGDRGGADLLVALAAAGAVLAAVATVAAGADSRPPVAADAPAPERRNAFTESDVHSDTVWPLIAAIDVVAIALATAAGATWLAAAGIAGVIPAAGWLAHVWREHPSFSPRVRSRVVERLLAPVGMPVLATVGVLFMAAMVSRVLLAVPEEVSTGTALAVAALLLFVLAFVASRPRIQSSALIGLAALALVGMVVAGGIGAKAGEREFEHEGEGPPVESITAKGLQFTLKTIEFPADTDVEVKFANRDTGTYHNVAFYTSLDADRKPLYNGKPIPEGSIDYKTRTPAAGTYAFICDFHPTTMTGKLVITAQ